MDPGTGTVSTALGRGPAPLERKLAGPVRRRAPALLLLATWLAACSDAPLEPSADAAPVAWPVYGGDPGGSQYSPLADITPDNVHRLRRAWVFHSGDLPGARGDSPSTWASEVTPILVEETLYLCTPTNLVIALDPETGSERWRFDPRIPIDGRYGNQLVCRGVAFWRDPRAPPGAACARRIFSSTNDARLFALDAATGRPCPGFGDAGVLDLNPAAGPQRWRGEYQVTSPPTLAGERVIVGAAVADNVRTDAPSGVLRAFDARTGRLAWAWDLRPPGFVATAENTSRAGYALGTPNVWAPLAVDEARDLVFAPTGNPAPDFYRDPDANGSLDYYGSSVVALRASTGEVIWHFQTVHRDLWDYDVPAQPTLFELRRDGRSLPALAQATKMGLVFVLHRETGDPLFPVEERPVPQGGVPGQQLSPTQPFPLRPPPLTRHRLRPEEVFGLTFWDRRRCREHLEGLRNEGIYTPPSLQGSFKLPGSAGGVNWGGLAVDAERQRLVANVMNLGFTVRLEARADADKQRPGAMRGTPYQSFRGPMLSPLGIPCTPPPWGTLSAVDLTRGDLAWQVPLGSLLGFDLGLPNLGGPLLTRSGLLFIGASFDRRLRAFDAASGEELWSARLPAGAQATPMSYRVRRGGRQFVLVAATGYGRFDGDGVGDALVAFALE